MKKSIFGVVFGVIFLAFILYFIGRNKSDTSNDTTDGGAGGGSQNNCTDRNPNLPPWEDDFDGAAIEHIKINNGYNDEQIKYVVSWYKQSDIAPKLSTFPRFKDRINNYLASPDVIPHWEAETGAWVCPPDVTGDGSYFVSTNREPSSLPFRNSQYDF